MPIRTVDLTMEQDDFVNAIVERGHYSNDSEALRDAVRELQSRYREEASNSLVLKAQLEAGFAALSSGDYTDLDETTLDLYLDGLATTLVP